MTRNTLIRPLLGLMVASATFTSLAHAAPKMMSGSKMSGGKMMHGKMMHGKMMGSKMSMSSSEKMMMMHMSATDKRTYMGMSKGEKMMMMKMMKMHMGKM